MRWYVSDEFIGSSTLSASLSLLILLHYKAKVPPLKMSIENGINNLRGSVFQHNLHYLQM